MNSVTLLTKSDCSLCEHAKQALARLEAEGLVETAVIDIGSEAGARLAAGAGMAFPPAVLLDGQPFCYGRLSERKLRRELTRRGAGTRGRA